MDFETLMNDPISLKNIKQTYTDLIQSNPNVPKESLQFIYGMDKTMFHPSFIKLVIKLGVKSDYGFRDLIMYNAFLDHVIFAKYVDTSTSNDKKQYESILYDYFSVIGKRFNIDPSLIMTNIMSILRLNVVVPSGYTTYKTDVVKIAFATDFIPQEVKGYTNAVDLMMMSENQLLESIMESETYHYKVNTIPSNVIELPTGTIQNVFNSIIQMQKIAFEANAKNNLDIRPFVLNTAFQENIARKVIPNNANDYY